MSCTSSGNCNCDNTGQGNDVNCQCTESSCTAVPEVSCGCSYDHLGRPVYYVPATPRDPYYVDDLAKAIMQNDGMNPIVVKIDGSIPVIKPFDVRTVYMPGFEGLPSITDRPYLSSYHLRSNPVLNVTQLPTGYNSATGVRTSKIIDRDKSRWLTIEATNVPVAMQEPPTRTAPTHYPRGRGAYPWWRTGYPGMNPSTGLG